MPEGDDPRVRDAARQMAESGCARPVVFTADPPLGVPWGAAVEWIDPTEPGLVSSTVERFKARRLARGGTIKPERLEIRAQAASIDPLLQAALMLHLGEVDGVVAGCVRSTADVLRAALHAVGLRQGCDTLSSAFYMVMAEGSQQERVLTFTDAGVVPNPTEDQMVDIAASATRARKAIVGDTPRVAFLSYSTHGSADGPDVKRVRAATARFASEYPAVMSDGELQGDAALLADVRSRKAPASTLEGAANVLVFPSLDAGNIAYKLVQRLAGATALGPILQGLAAPLNDLSRGASARDIVLVSCITALQSRA